MFWRPMFPGSVYRLLCWHKQRRQRCKVINNYPGIWQCCSLLISCTRPNDSADVLHLHQFRYQPWTGIRSLRLQLSSHLLAHDSPHIPRQIDKHQWRLHLQYFSNFSKTETNRICPVALTAVPKSTDSAFYLPQDGEISISCTHPFNSPLWTTRVSRYQKGKTNLDFTKARDSGISWAICKSAPHSRQISMPVPHHSVFYRPDLALPAAQPTASKHWRTIVSAL